MMGQTQFEGLSPIFHKNGLFTLRELVPRLEEGASPLVCGVVIFKLRRELSVLRIHSNNLGRDSTHFVWPRP